MATLAGTLSLDELEGSAWLSLSGCLGQRGAFDEALELAERARALGAAASSPQLEIDALGALSTLTRQQGQLVDALARCEEGLGLARRHGLKSAESRSLELLANIHVEAGALDLAKDYVRRAAELAHELGEDMRGYVLDMLLGNLEHVADRLQQAAGIYSRVLTAAREVGDCRTEAFATAYLAFVRWEQGDQTLAELMLRDAIALLQQIGELRYEMFARSALAVILAGTGRFQMAGALLDEAERQLEHDALWWVAVELCRGMMECEVARVAALPGEHNTLLASARTRLELAQNTSSPLAPALLTRSAEVRRLSQLLERALAEPEAARTKSRGGRVVVIDRKGRWFEPFAERRVDLSRRAPMARILLALASAHAEGTTLSAHELIAVGWPGERMLPEAAQNRLHVTLSRLRSLGLRDALQSSGEGYALDPDIVVELS